MLRGHGNPYYRNLGSTLGNARPVIDTCSPVKMRGKTSDSLRGRMAMG